MTDGKSQFHFGLESVVYGGELTKIILKQSNEKNLAKNILALTNCFFFFFFIVNTASLPLLSQPMHPPSCNAGANIYNCCFFTKLFS